MRTHQCLKEKQFNQLIIINKNIAIKKRKSIEKYKKIYLIFTQKNKRFTCW